MKLYKSLVDRLNNQHEAINHLIKGADQPRLIFQPAPDKWSVHDNITHLAKYQPVFAERMQAILKSDSPLFDRYSAGDDPDFEAWRGRETSDLIKALGKDRDAIFKMITGLSEQELARVGFHKKFGRLNIIQWTEFFLLHEAHHIFTIFQLAHEQR
ncbi:MAG TPA: DinB family protein [Nitrosopumilaceae archaeon]|jgi:hypothetical protein|nr:DinB family protein [Nitrosopumilaceae archaeon]